MTGKPVIERFNVARIYRGAQPGSVLQRVIQARIDG